LESVEKSYLYGVEILKSILELASDSP